VQSKLELTLKPNSDNALAKNTQIYNLLIEFQPEPGLLYQSFLGSGIGSLIKSVHMLEDFELLLGQDSSNSLGLEMKISL
jgi:hypothetical protein